MPSALPPELAPPPIDDETRAFRAAFARMVEWYRVEQSQAVWRAFWPGAFVLLPLGSLLVALAMVDRLVAPALQPLLTVCGVLVTATGPAWAITQLLRSMRCDLYVAIRVDGLALRLDPAEPEQVYTWDHILDVGYDPLTAQLSVTLASGEQLAVHGPFAELDLPELGRRIRNARRLAVWNRLEPRFAGAEGSD